MIKQFTLKLCSDGNYYIHKNNELIIPYVDFDRFNRESAEKVVDLLNKFASENTDLKQVNKMLQNNVEKLSNDVEYLKELPSEHLELWKQTEIKRMNLAEENKHLRNLIEHKNNYINRLLYKPILTDVLPQAKEIITVNTELEKENSLLKKELFEAKKDYLIETSDEVDRALYLEYEIEELRKEIFK